MLSLAVDQTRFDISKPNYSSCDLVCFLFLLLLSPFSHEPALSISASSPYLSHDVSSIHRHNSQRSQKEVTRNSLRPVHSSNEKYDDILATTEFVRLCNLRFPGLTPLDEVASSKMEELSTA